MGGSPLPQQTGRRKREWLNKYAETVFTTSLIMVFGALTAGAVTGLQGIAT